MCNDRMTMKKIFSLMIILVVATLTTSVSAREQKLTAAERATAIAKEMNLDNATQARFVPLYINYVNDIEKVFKKYPMVRETKEKTEAELKRMTDNRFAVARAILDIREKYYHKFQKILNARQIDAMYRAEKRYEDAHNARGGHKTRRHRASSATK